MSHDPKLKAAMQEISAICKRQDVGGWITLVSETHSEFCLLVTPTWSGFKWEPDEKTNRMGLRLRVKKAEVGKEKAHRLIELSSHLIFQIRDLCAQGFSTAEKLCELIKSQTDVVHKSYSGFEPHRED